ncbi:MAG: dihydrofolate reductase [Planctomycetota bacterium]
MSTNGAPVALIAAMSADRVIGASDGMPWDVPEEYARYLDTVRGATVIMGRKSFEIFGDDLDNDLSIIVTRGDAVAAGVRVARGVGEAIALARSTDRPIFVAGGASIYEQALPKADRMLLSEIHGGFAGDTYFPVFDESEWEVHRLEEHERYTFREYGRVARPA